MKLCAYVASRTLIAKERDKDKGGNSRTALEARAKAVRFEQDLAALGTVDYFKYRDAKVGDYPKGQLGHNDVNRNCNLSIQNNATFRQIMACGSPISLSMKRKRCGASTPQFFGFPAPLFVCPGEAERANQRPRL